MGISRIPTFKDLEVWRKSMDLVARIYEVTRDYPADERYGLVAETRETSRSVPCNIAEGKRRISTKEFRQFVSIAMGSLAELHTQVLIAVRFRYIPEDVVKGLEGMMEEIGRMLRGLERALA